MQRDDSLLKELQDALISAYPTLQDLEMMVYYGLHKHLAAVASPGNLEHTVFQLIRWAEAQGRLKELIEAACAQNPKNPQLLSVAERLGLLHGQHSATVVSSARISQADEDRLLREGRRWQTVGKVSGVVSLILLLVCSMSGSARQSDPGQVTTLADNGDGSLRQVLLVASPGSTITFAPDLYGTLVLNKDLDIEKNVTILGPDSGQITISNDHQSDVHIYIHQGTTTSFSNFTFADSLVSRQSFIYNEGNLTLNNCSVQGNISYDDGGGIENQGTLVITGSHILRNFSSGNGGGIDNKGIMTITTSLVSFNTAYENGGGISTLHGSLNLNGTQILDNQALDNKQSRGGGIVAFNSLLDITDSAIKENWTPGVGGGVSVLGSQAFLASSVIVGNMAGEAPELAVERDPENKKNGLVVLANLALPPDPKPSIGKPQDHIQDIIKGHINYDSSRPQIESVGTDDTIAGDPATALLPPEESPNYRGIIHLDTYCHQLGYVTFDPTEPFNLSCVSSSGVRKKVDPLQICHAQYPRDHITMSRLSDYFDSTTWQCYTNVKLLGSIISIDKVNNFCKSTKNTGISLDNITNAYDWRCLHPGGTLGYYNIHMDSFPVGLSVDDMCQYTYKNQIMSQSTEMSSLTDYESPGGWACWELL